MIEAAAIVVLAGAVLILIAGRVRADRHHSRALSRMHGDLAVMARELHKVMRP